MPNIDFDPGVGCPNPEFVFPGGRTVGVAIAENISAVNAPGTVTMSIRRIAFEAGGFETETCFVCTSPQTVFGVTLTVAGSSVAISGAPDTAGVTLVFTLRATADGVNCDRTYRMELVRQPLDLVLVLDRSGSMDWGYNGSFSPPAGQRRWDGLLTGIGVLESQLSMLTLLSGDMLGMRLFASSVVTPSSPFNTGLVSMQANVSELQIVLNPPVAPEGGTAMGAGILAGRDLLLPGTAGSNKAMIVFTDGQQNVGDLVNPALPTQTNSGQPLRTRPGQVGEIDIHTVCLANNGPHADLMQNIAAQNGGEHLITSTGQAADFSTFFALHLPNILAGSSPQYVDLRRSAFPASIEGEDPTYEHTFSVNRGVTALVVTLLAPTRQEPHFQSLARDGTELIQFAEQTRGPDFVSIGLRFPVDEGGGTLDGEWTVRVGLGTRPRSEVPFTLMVLVDDHLVKPTYRLGAERPKVDDVLSPTVTLHRAGNAIPNAQVRALVQVPGDDVDDLTALANVDFSIDPNDPNSPDIAKLAALLEDPGFLERIRLQDRLVNLSYDASRDAYVGSFNGLDVAGIYQVIYRISFDDPDLGRIRRFHQQSVYVRFPDVDLDNSQVTLSSNQQGLSVLTFRPRASNGRLIGSGWGGAIRLDAPDASITSVVDNGDGSYRLVITGPLTGQGKLSISDAPVYQGDLRDLGCYRRDLGLFERIRCWLVRLGLPGWLLWILLVVLAILLWLAGRRRD